MTTKSEAPDQSFGASRLARTLLTRNAILAPHVYACATGDWVVFLDLRRDRYQALSASALSRVAWRRLGIELGEIPDTIGECAPSQDEAMLQKLLAAGLAAPAPPAHPEERAQSMQRLLLRLPDPAAWLWACVWAHRILLSKRLDRAALNLTAWKRGVSAPLRQSGVVERFEHLRPWFPRRRVCLFDALALMAFALTRRVSADWVMGVRGRPFAAHCWLETEGEIVSVTDDDCASFTPIMRV